MTRQVQDFEDRYDEVITRYDEYLAESALPQIESSLNTTAAEQADADVTQDTVVVEFSAESPSQSHRLRRVLHCLDLLEMDRRRSDRPNQLPEVVLTPGETQHSSENVDSPIDPLKRVRSESPRFAETFEHRCISRFTILKKLGSGGFGIVFLAEDPVLRRKVALKIPRLRTVSSPDLQQRFVRESQLVARLTHPNVVPIYEAGNDGAVSYQVTEYCSGGSLAAYLKESHQSSNNESQCLLRVDIAADLLIGIADGVQHAHDHGILHRDLKPANILLQPRTESLRESENRSLPFAPDSLSRDYQVRVSDFGLAKLFAETFLEHDETTTTLDNSSEQKRKYPDAGSDGSELRNTAMAGTPRYVAPEQLLSSTSNIGPATDVYALGAILYEVLCGVPPFSQTDLTLLREAIRNSSAAPFVAFRPDVPRDLEAICFKAMSKNSADRYAAAGLLADDLRAFLRGDPVAARPWSTMESCVKWSRKRPVVAGLLATVGVLLLGLIGFGFWHLGRLGDANLRLNQTVQLLQEQTLAADKSSELAKEKSRVAAEQTLLAEEQRRSAERYSRLAREREYSATMLHAADLYKNGNLSQLSSVLQSLTIESQSTPYLPKYNEDLRGFEWFYLWNQSRSEMDLRGQISTSRNSQVTADGKQCLSLSREGAICRWDLLTGQLLDRFQIDRQYPIEGSSFSADGHRLAVLYRELDKNEYMLSVWDTKSRNPLLQRSGEQAQASTCILSPCGSTVLWQGLDRGTEHDGAVILEALDVESGRKLRIATSNISPDADVIWLNDLAISPDSSTLFIHAHFAGGSRVYSTSLKDVISAFSAGEARTEFLPVWKPLTESYPGIGGVIMCSPDGKHLAVGNREPNIVRIIDVTTGQCRLTTDQFDEWDYQLCFEGNERLAIGHIVFTPELSVPAIPLPRKGVLTIWDLKSDTRSSSDADVSCLAWHEPTHLRIVGRMGGQLTAIREHHPEAFFTLPGHQPSEAWGVAFSPNSQRLFSVGDDSALKVWDIESRTLVETRTEHTALVSCIAVSPDGRWIATGSYDDTVNLWDAETLTVKHRLTGHDHDLRVLAFSSDSETLASGGRGQQICLWNVSTGTLRRSVTRYDSVVRGLAFLSDDDFVESNASGQVVLHNERDETTLLVKDRSEIHSLAFISLNGEAERFREGLLSSRLALPSPCQQALVFGGKFGTVDVLPIEARTIFSNQRVSGSDVSSDTMILPTVPLKRFYGVDIRTIAISPDHHSIAVAGDDRVVHILSLQTGAELLSFDNLPAPTNQLAFSPDSGCLAAVLHNGEIRIWSATVSTTQRPEH